MKLKTKISVTLGGLMALLFVSACTPGQILLSAEVGIKMAAAIKSAKDKHPDDFTKRAVIYAGLYCDFREDKGLEWQVIRDTAQQRGAPEWALTRIETLIDKECGL